MLAPAVGASARDTYRPKKHFLSWESANAHDKLRPWRKMARPERDFWVKRRKVVRLKKPSLFNRRPVQFSTPVVDGDVLFVGNNASMFYAVDMNQMIKLWSVHTEGGIESPAAVDDANVFLGDIKGYAYSLDKRDGAVKWKVWLEGEMLGAPLVVADRVYFVTLDGRLFAMSKSTGAEIWHTDTMERQVGFTVRRQSSPIYYGGAIIYGTSQGTLVSYGEDASLNWVRMLGDPQSQVMDVDSRPIVIDGRLYATSVDKELFCLDPADGTIIWAIGAGGANDLLYHDGMLYTSGRGVVYAVDPASGTIIWEQNLETPGISSPAGGKGFIAVVSTKDKLYLIDEKNGDIVFERYVRKGSYGDPIVVGEEVYLLANSSRLFSFIVREKVKNPKEEKQAGN
jgi:outer membrane protein assembly factor BamB